ncbi:hypothetical protein Q9233_014571 [Columba guinea]|nr:hypothetical protein Q9233_014571 [Columba guinea]
MEKQWGGHRAASAMSTEGQRADDSPSTSGGSSDGDQREGVQQEQEREQVQPKKKEGKISSKTAAKLSTSAKRASCYTGVIAYSICHAAYPSFNFPHPEGIALKSNLSYLTCQD